MHGDPTYLYFVEIIDNLAVFNVAIWKLKKSDLSVKVRNYFVSVLVAITTVDSDFDELSGMLYLVIAGESDTLTWYKVDTADFLGLMTI